MAGRTETPMNVAAVVQHTSGEYLGLIEDHLEGRRIRFQYFRPFAAGKVPADDVPADAEVGRTVGWDSIAHMELITAMEEYLDTEIPTEDALDISNLADVVRVLDKYG